MKRQNFNIQPLDAPYADAFLRDLPQDRQELEEELWDVELPKQEIPE